MYPNPYGDPNIPNSALATGHNFAQQPQNVIGYYAYQQYGQQFGTSYPMQGFHTGYVQQAPGLQYCHKLETGFRSKYIKAQPVVQQRYSIYETRINDINNVCNKYKHQFQSFLAVLSGVCIIAGSIVFAVRKCVKDPQGLEKTCTEIGTTTGCYYTTCSIPFYIPLIPIISGSLILVIISIYSKIVAGRLISSLQSKLVELNQMDAGTGVNWSLRSMIQHHSSNSGDGNSRSTTTTYLSNS
jgi:hypothetical protein